MSDMIERVAQAIRSGMEASPCVRVQANGPHGEAALQQLFEVLAMDAIEAMREPTQEMIMSPDGNTGCAQEVWQAMIETALK